MSKWRHTPPTFSSVKSRPTEEIANEDDKNNCSVRYRFGLDRPPQHGECQINRLPSKPEAQEGAKGKKKVLYKITAKKCGKEIKKPASNGCSQTHAGDGKGEPGAASAAVAKQKEAMAAKSGKVKGLCSLPRVLASLQKAVIQRQSESAAAAVEKATAAAAGAMNEQVKQAEAAFAAAAAKAGRAGEAAAAAAAKAGQAARLLPLPRLDKLVKAAATAGRRPQKPSSCWAPLLRLPVRCCRDAAKAAGRWLSREPLLATRRRPAMQLQTLR